MNIALNFYVRLRTTYAAYNIFSPISFFLFNLLFPCKPVSQSHIINVFVKVLKVLIDDTGA